MIRNIALLTLCQALLMTAGSGFISTAPLVGQALASHPGLASLPVGAKFLGNVLFTFPASLLMKRVGRRIGFMVGAGLGISGAALGAYAIMEQHFWLFCLGALIFGTANSFGQFYRFAAADAATITFRSRAISWVLAGGVVAAFTGPTLAALSRQWLDLPFAGSYLAITGVFCLSLLVTSLLTIPPPTAAERKLGGRPLAVIARQPRFVVAVLGGTVGYGVMNLLMTSTPLAMSAHAHPFENTALVIQWHIVGMFGPSFFTGHLIARFGVLTIMASGGLLLLAAVVSNLMGTELVHFWAGLFLLGLGWNFLYIGGTTLLTETYEPAEKAKAQALNDVVVFATVTCTAFSAGALHSQLGWQSVNLGALPLISITLLATGWLAWRGRSQTQPIRA